MNGSLPDRSLPDRSLPDRSLPDRSLPDRPGAVLDGFEQRLLSELASVARAQAADVTGTSHLQAGSGRRRTWLLPTAGTAVAAAVAVAAVVTVSRPAPAFAVTGGNGDEVKVEVNRLEGADALQRALGERGIPADITYLPSDRACRSGRYAQVRTPGLSLSVAADRFEVTIPPGAVGPGDTFVLSAAVTPLDDGVRASVDFGIARGPVAPCEVVDAR